MKQIFTSLNPKACFATWFLLVCCFVSKAQVSGNVYWDINNDGVRTSAAFPFEKGVYGISVKAYNSANIMVGSVTTNASGDYSMTGVTIFPVRLEFTTPSDVQAARPSSSISSNVQFISAATTTANLGVISSSNYASTNNPYVVSNAYSNGNALATGAAEAGLRQNMIVFPYALDNTKKTGANYQNRWLGSVFGITSQKETGIVLMSAYLKRHASFGPGGIDAIYKTVVNASGDASQPSVLLNLSSLGINVGIDPRTVTLPANPGTANADIGVFGQVGKLGIGNIDLADNGKDLFISNLFENKIHRINIGMPVKSSFSATDVTGTWSIPGPGHAGTEWHIMGVKYFQGKVYVGGISSKQRIDAPAASQADLDADQVNLNAYVYELDPSNGTITQVLMTPLNYRRGNVINQYRYEYKNNYWRAWQNNGDIDIIRNDFNTGMETYPQPSAPYNTLNNTGLIYPQPMLSDIEFDADGSMIIALRDRFGDQGGMNNYFEGMNGNIPTSGGNLFRVFACGDVLRAGKSGALWTIENNGAVTNNGELTDANTANIQGIPPAAASSFSGSFNPMSGSPWGWNNSSKGFGPGGRYFYYNHAFDAAGVPVANIQDGAFSGSSVHYTKSYGGIAIMPANDELIQTSLSPEGGTFSSGVIRFSNHGLQAGTNAGNMTDQQELIPSISTSGGPDAFGKANGMGDVEIISNALPIEIGNRLWHDLNNNGRQDANETGITGITIVLRSPGANSIFGDGDDQTWSTVTGTDGHYYFNNTTVDDNRKTTLGYSGVSGVNSGILNNQLYRLELNMAQAGISSMLPALANTGNDNIDNDAVYGNLPGLGNRLYTDVNTTSNDFNFDFGVKSGTLPADKLTLKATQNGSDAMLIWQTQSESNTDKFIIEKNSGNGFTVIGEKTAAGFSQQISTYTMPYNTNAEKAGVILFRIKLVDKDGSFTYSNTALLKNYLTAGFDVAPNPFKNTITVFIYAAEQTIAHLTIVDANSRAVYQKNNIALVKGNNQITVSQVEKFPAGSYQLILKSADGSMHVKKVMKE